MEMTVELRAAKIDNLKQTLKMIAKGIDEKYEVRPGVSGPEPTACELLCDELAIVTLAKILACTTGAG